MCISCLEDVDLETWIETKTPSVFISSSLGSGLCADLSSAVLITWAASTGQIRSLEFIAAFPLDTFQCTTALWVAVCRLSLIFFLRSLTHTHTSILVDGVWIQGCSFSFCSDEKGLDAPPASVSSLNLCSRVLTLECELHLSERSSQFQFGCTSAGESVKTDLSRVDSREIWLLADS